MIRFLSIVAMLLALTATSFAGSPVRAQEATPMAGACEAPELPPGTPTPMDMGTPGAMDEMDEAEMAGMEGMATPVAEEPTAPEAAPAGTPADPAASDAAVAALENIVNCISTGDFMALAALMTDSFIQNFMEVPTPYDVPASMEGAQPVEIREIGAVNTYDDGRVSVDWLYGGLFNGPGALSSERWFFVEEDGIYKLDNIMPVPVSADAVPGATIVDVQMIDYSFVLDTSTIPAGPVIFRTTNASQGGEPHVNVIVTLAEGATAEQVMQGEFGEESITGFFGAVFLEPGQSGDLVFEELEPGTYFLVCDVETADGTPHFELGMVAQITVE